MKVFWVNLKVCNLTNTTSSLFRKIEADIWVNLLCGSPHTSTMNYYCDS